VAAPPCRAKARRVLRLVELDLRHAQTSQFRAVEENPELIDNQSRLDLRERLSRRSFRTQEAAPLASSG